MNEQKTNITNRSGLGLVAVAKLAANPKGLAFVMPGLGGSRQQMHIQSIADAFIENDISVVCFDPTNSFGQSDGRYEDATTTNYYHDLADVIAWAEKQPWYREPFYLAGHSLGGICIAIFAQAHQKKIKGLAPISPVVSGTLSLEARRRYDAAGLTRWQQSGWDEQPSSAVPGLVKRLPWSHMEDRLRYDLLPEVNKLTMPVLLVVGEHDTRTPPDHVRILYDALPGPKTFPIRTGVPTRH